MIKLKETLVAGFIKENPVLRLVLGICPTLAVTTKAFNGLGMGVVATLVLMSSNLLISLLRKVIPQQVRIPAYITIIAGFVTSMQMLVKAYAPAVDEALGIFLPLIVVNCIILGRAESFASKNKPLLAVLDGLGMGIGFTGALLLMGSVREVLGNGTWFDVPLNPVPMLVFILPPGGFFVFGLLIAIVNKIGSKKGQEAAHLSCGGCLLSKNCDKATEGGC